MGADHEKTNYEAMAMAAEHHVRPFAETIILKEEFCFMKSMKKYFAIALSALISLSMLAGCSGSTGSSSAAQSKMCIRDSSQAVNIMPSDLIEEILAAAEEDFAPKKEAESSSSESQTAESQSTSSEAVSYTHLFEKEK